MLVSTSARVRSLLGQIDTLKAANRKLRNAASSPSLLISSNFDAGNISVVDASDPMNVQLKLQDEPYTIVDQKSHKQWFYFRVANAKDTACRFHIVNAHEASYAECYHGYHACASSDRKNWRRVPTAYRDGKITISVTPSTEVFWISYFAPYSYEQHQELVTRCMLSPLCEHVEVLGQSLDGRDIECMQIGTGPLKIFVTARQHPGETQAEWFMDGLLARLLDPNDPVGTGLREGATVYVVPNMNPDGSVRGHLRTNARYLHYHPVHFSSCIHVIMFTQWCQSES
jgi:murein tripeptide amidase MpaA